MRVVYLLLLLLIVKILFAQREYLIEKKNSILFNEFSISVNRTDLGKYSSNNKTGFGFSTLFTARSAKRINILFGIEYNNTKYYANLIGISHFSYVSDATYSINTLSIPFFLRTNFGKKIKLFVELGGFLDFNLFCSSRGVEHTYYPNNNNQIKYSERNYYAVSSSVTGFNFGPSLGVGINIPISKYSFILKTDYKLGIRELFIERTSLYNQYIRLIIGVKI